MNKMKTIYIIFITICAVLFFSAFAIVFHRAEYDKKVLEKLGLKKPIEKTNWAVFSWNNMLEKLDYDADVVFFGDSITRGSDFRKYFPDKKIVNLGYSGDTLVGMINRVSGIVAIKPKKIFILGGINGLSDANLSKCVETYGNLIDTLTEKMPNTELYFQSILPISSKKELSICHNTTIIKFNKRIEQIVKEKGATFIDLFSLYELNGEMNPKLTKDGIHLLPEAYELWAEEIAEFIH